MIFEPRDYQRIAIRYILDRPRCALFLDMGLGKTVSTLTAVQALIDYGDVTRVLVVTPKKVADSTWNDEADKWDHLRLRVTVVRGTPARRVRLLGEPADVHVISRDSFKWLCGHFDGKLPYEMVVLDEMSSFKTPSSLRFKAAKKSLPFVDRVVGLTGTPVANGLVDLWGQIYLLDGGKRLEPFVTRYKEKYFDRYIRNNIEIRCTPRPGSMETILGRISDICLSMQAKDWLTLPGIMINDVAVSLPEPIRRRYEEFERDCVLEFAASRESENTVITAASAAALMTKLSQMANGAVYDSERNWHVEHDEKLDMLADIAEAADTPVLVFYQYLSDRYRIERRFPEAVPYENEETLRRWNDGKIRMLLAHPASCAFGLNMQRGGRHIVWMSTGWNLELYLQANARLHRQGQTRPVIVSNLIATGTVDERMAAAIRGKDTNQTAVLTRLAKNICKEHGVYT